MPILGLLPLALMRVPELRLGKWIVIIPLTQIQIVSTDILIATLAPGPRLVFSTM